MHKKPFLVVCLLALVTMLHGLDAQGLLEEGMKRYSQGSWQDAIVSLRRALAQTPADSTRSEAIYWIALSRMALADYDGAWQDLDTLLDTMPSSVRAVDGIYQKGRILYYQSRYDEAITVLKSYMDMVKDPAKESAASYWIGESLFALGRLDEARAVFAMITSTWPSSIKYEASSYRIALIDQKAIEQELLTLLKWTHEESLKTLEDYQRRERSYEQAIVVYQKRIADMLKDTRLADLEAENKGYKLKISELEQTLADQNDRLTRENSRLKAELARTASELEAARASTTNSPVNDTILPKTPEIEEPADESENSDTAVPDASLETTSSEDDMMARLEALRLQAIKVQEALLEKIKVEGSNE